MGMKVEKNKKKEILNGYMYQGCYFEEDEVCRCCNEQLLFCKLKKD